MTRPPRVFITFRQRIRTPVEHPTRSTGTRCAHTMPRLLAGLALYARFICGTDHSRNARIPTVWNATARVLQFLELPSSTALNDNPAQRRCRRREVVGRVRRSNEEPRGSSRSGATSPRRRAPRRPRLRTRVRGGAPAGGSTSRLSPRNWRVPTRLNAILLIPVARRPGHRRLPGEGLRRHLAARRRTPRTPRCVVRAAAAYGQALLNERDLTAAAAAVQQARPPPRSSEVRATTDARRAEVRRRASQNMPDKPGLERRLKLFKSGGAAPPRAAQGRLHRGDGPGEDRRGLHQGPALADGVLQRTRPGHRQHHQLRPHRLRDRAGQGRRVAAALDRHAPAGAPEPGGAQLQRPGRPRSARTTTWSTSPSASTSPAARRRTRPGSRRSWRARPPRAPSS